MIEIFRTNVSDIYYAKILVAKIQKIWPGYRVNFDLTDCDRILRVQSNMIIDSNSVIKLVENFGYSAEILPDLLPDLIPGRLTQVAIS